MPNRWTNFLKAYAEKYGKSYMCMLGNEKISQKYRQKYPACCNQPTGRPIGRPRKYATEAEAKKAKLEQTTTSNFEIRNGYKEPRHYTTPASKGKIAIRGYGDKAYQYVYPEEIGRPPLAVVPQGSRTRPKPVVSGDRYLF